MIGASFDSTKTPLHDLLTRSETLLQRIEASTDNTITREPASFRASAVRQACDERPKERDAEKPLDEAMS